MQISDKLKAETAARNAETLGVLSDSSKIAETLGALSDELGEPSKEVKETVDTLSETAESPAADSAFFANVGDFTEDAIGSATNQRVKCGPGGVIAARGENACAAFYLLKGTVKETVVFCPGDENSKQTLELASYVAGDFFGYGGMSLSAQTRRPTSFVSTSQSEFRRVPKHAFLHW